MNEIDRLNMNVNQAMADLTSVKDAIVNNGVEVADGTPSSNYGDKVDAVYKAGKQNATETVSNVIIDKIGSTPTGKNLITYPYIETTKADDYFAITDNGDGTLTVSGDYETTTISEFLLADLSHIKAKAGDTFTISQGDANFEAFIQFECICVDGMSYNVEPMSGSETFTLPDDFVSFGICKLYVYNVPVTVDNFTFYPMLVKGSTVVDWDPYTDSIQLDIMPEKIDEVYEAGKSEEWNKFWDVYQRNGTRRNYHSAFAGEGWHKDTFKPKYLIAPNAVWGAKNLFYHFGLGYTDVLDFREVAHWFDFTNVDDASNMFDSAKINHIEIDLSNKCTNLNGCFSCEWNKTGRTHITLKVSEKCTSYSSTFAYCGELTHLFFMDGSKIAGSMGVSTATGLVKESIESVIRALWDGASGKTLTLSKTAVINAFGSTTSQEWLNLVATKSNWTISLV